MAYPTSPFLEGLIAVQRRNLLLCDAADLDRAAQAMLDDHAHQLHVRKAYPDVYRQRAHAIIIAAHIRGICAGIERLLKLALEYSGCKLSEAEQGGMALIRLAKKEVRGVRPALIDAEGAKAMRALIPIDETALLSPGGTDPEAAGMVLEYIAVAVTACKAIKSIREKLPQPCSPAERRH